MRLSSLGSLDARTHSEHMSFMDGSVGSRNPVRMACSRMACNFASGDTLLDNSASHISYGKYNGKKL